MSISRSLASSSRSLGTRAFGYSISRPRWSCPPPICSAGTKTPVPDDAYQQRPKSPFYFETGYALFAKRPSRPFPPPFLSMPSGSFSDPLSTHNRSRDRRSYVNGEMIRGITNGDDAVLVGENFIGANDGVGAWVHRDKGHAALWSRLILHFWALEAERDTSSSEPNPVEYLQRAFEQTISATSSPNELHGTTTACAALLHHYTNKNSTKPLLYVTNLGDSQVLVIRPNDEEVVYKTTEQWHWFDCPRQLGTNSPDTPISNAVMDKVSLEVNDVVLAMSDGVTDNLWEHEVVQNVVNSIRKWKSGDVGDRRGDRNGGAGGRMLYVAEELMKAAKVIAEDPYAESPFMERAVEEGLAMEGVGRYQCRGCTLQAEERMRSPMITQGLQGAMAGSLFAFKCGWNPFEELADDQEQDGDSDPLCGMKHDRRIHLELAKSPSLHALQLKKAAFFAPEQSQVRTEVTLEKDFFPNIKDKFDGK